MNSLTREQRIYAAAGASILFVISMFFNWFGTGGFDSAGTDVIPSWWILLIFSLGAAALLVAEAISFDLPSAINPPSWAAYLTSVSFIVTLMIFLEGGHGAGRKLGLFLGLIFSLVAVVLSVMHWREQAK